VTGTDSIVVRGIRAEGRHGLPGERDVAQPFVVDVEIGGSVSAAASADRLDATIDYGVVACEVRDVIESKSFELIETLAVEIAERVRALGAGSVRVRVSKPRAADALGVDDIAVVVER
jgi:dihydroneopterin aldolase